MMNFTEEKIEAPIFFKEYNKNSFKLNIGAFSSSLILSYNKILNENNNIKNISDITEQHLDLLLESNPEIIIIGTGKNQEIPSIEIISYLAKAGKSLDFMNSDAACRTYNLLVGENRNVSAIVII